MRGMTTDEELLRLATLAGADLLDAERRLVTAESCSGGWVAKLLTDIAGSSGWYDGGVVAYSNTLKQSLLGVRPSTLASHGAVSEATAREIDIAVREIVDSVYTRTLGILKRERATLQRWAEKLLEKETLVEAELEDLRRAVSPTALA